MACPYCVERISAQAVVCPHCQRDLLFFVPVQCELRAQAKRIDSLEQQNAQLMSLLARHWGALDKKASSLSASDAAIDTQRPDRLIAPGDALAETASTAAVLPALSWKAALARVLLPAIFLVLAHALIVLVLDLNQIWLRVASILAPLSIGFAFAMRRKAPLALHACYALAVALLSVAAMTGVVAHLDELPFWPQDVREWREVIYYIASIAFSDLTGVLLARLVWHWRQRSTNQAMAQLGSLMGNAPASSRVQQVRRRAEELRDIIALLTPIVTAIVSVVTGIVAFFK